MIGMDDRGDVLPVLATTGVDVLLPTEDTDDEDETGVRVGVVAVRRGVVVGVTAVGVVTGLPRPALGARVWGVVLLFGVVTDDVAGVIPLEDLGLVESTDCPEGDGLSFIVGAVP